MIRMAQPADFPDATGNEQLVRIVGLYRAYGLNCGFLHFWCDGKGGLLSLLDGFAVLYTPCPLNEEWIGFLTINSDVKTVHAKAESVVRLSKNWNTEARTGRTLKRDGAVQATRFPTTTPSPRQIYPLLERVFPQMPPFEPWYMDVSHRLRHSACRIVAVEQDGHPVSVAMTVAEAANAVLIGYVATDPALRGHGYAGACLATLTDSVERRMNYINPVDEYAANLYQKYGFVPAGTWGEIVKPGE